MINIQTLTASRLAAEARARATIAHNEIMQQRESLAVARSEAEAKARKTIADNAMLHDATQQALGAMVADAAKLQAVADTWNIATETAPAVEVRNQVQRVVANPNGPVIEWADKKGNIQARYSDAVAAHAPKDARLEEAYAKTLQQLQGGVFGPFIKDVRNPAILAKPYQEAMECSIREALTITGEDGIHYVPMGAEKAVNKKVALAICAFLLAPETISKGVRASKDLPKAKQYLATIAKRFLDSEAEREAAKHARALAASSTCEALTA